MHFGTSCRLVRVGGYRGGNYWGEDRGWRGYGEVDLDMSEGGIVCILNNNSNFPLFLPSSIRQ